MSVCVGIVKSAYIPPQDPNNPLHTNQTFKDVRLVEWFTKDEVNDPSLNFLVNLKAVVSNDLTNQEYD